MKKILVVDNHPVMLKFMSNLLGKQGHQVLTAQDGLSALDLLKTFIPDVIFVDLVMPNIAGEKLCRIIRSMPKMKDVFLVILSGIAAEQGIDFDLLGINACIAKGPFDKLARHVLSILERADIDGPGVRTKQVIGLEDIFQREVSKELISSRMHLESILNNMSEGILELNFEARIVYANPAAISLIGVSEETLISSTFTDLFGEDQKGIINDLLPEIGHEPLIIGESSSVMINNRQVVLNVLKAKEDVQGMYIVIINDISERKKLQTQIRQAQMMESIATLAGGIAHQFNNALSVIIGNLELLKMEQSEDADRTEFLDPIKNAAYRMSTLTSQLLAYARGGKYNPKIISLGKFIENTLPLIQHSIGHSVFVQKNLPPYVLNVEADITQLQMVLSAVLNNAAEAIEGHGQIRLNITDKEIQSGNPHLEPGHYACISIEDDGKGMDEETRARIFEPFFTTYFQGRGLGMAAVYGIIKNHNGWISVDSKLGKGTTVCIYLPAFEDLESKKEDERPKLEKGSGTILLIEDESMVLDVCGTMLKNLNYSVLEAKTGAEAINIAKTFDGVIDLALLDIELPDMDGSSLYPFLKEARQNLKVIVCSGYSLDGPVQEIIEAGAQGFIQKPFDLRVLSKKLKEILETGKK
jgi:two-component system, cell cycle sensor histidine kinase and response regulator CckA